MGMEVQGKREDIEEEGGRGVLSGKERKREGDKEGIRKEEAQKREEKRYPQGNKGEKRVRGVAKRR